MTIWKLSLRIGVSVWSVGDNSWVHFGISIRFLAVSLIIWFIIWSLHIWFLIQLRNGWFKTRSLRFQSVTMISIQSLLRLSKIQRNGLSVSASSTTRTHLLFVILSGTLLVRKLLRPLQVMLLWGINLIYILVLRALFEIIDIIVNWCTTSLSWVHSLIRLSNVRYLLLLVLNSPICKAFILTSACDAYRNIFTCLLL